MLSPFMNKICIACNKRPARIKFIKVVDGKWQDCLICQTCAMRFASQQGAGNILKLEHILKGLMDQGASPEPSMPGKTASSPGLATVTPDLTCTGCGLSFVSYRNTLILGCSECYNSFHDRLLDDLRRFHGSVRHVGRLPGQAAATRPASGTFQTVMQQPAGMAESVPVALVADVSAPAGPLSASEIIAIKKQLHEAIAREDFELAARLRDQLRQADRKPQG